MLRVGVLGHGAIGSAVVDALHAGAVPGARLAGVRTTRSVPDGVRATGDVDELAANADLVVEAATADAVAEHGERILVAGCDLLVLSTGALVDDDLAHRLRRAGPGRLVLSSGAIGGLDLLRAAARDGGLEHVRLTTTKRSATLVQPWMDPATRAALDAAVASVDVFTGPAGDAVRRFPRSLNVAASLALAVGSWDRVHVRLVGDPHAAVTHHVVDAAGPAGSYRFESRGPTSAANPASSRIVPQAVLRAITDLATGRPATAGAEAWGAPLSPADPPWRFL